MIAHLMSLIPAPSPAQWLPLRRAISLSKVDGRSFSRSIGRSLAGATATLVLAMGALMLTPQVANAQGMRMMTGGMDLSATRITSRSVEDYVRLLKLDETQAEAATALFDGYSAAHKAATDEVEAKFEEAQQAAMENRDFQKMGVDASKIMTDYQDKTRKLEEDMLSNLKELLTPDQVARWETVERHRRREKNLRYGFYSGAAVDLIRIIDRQKLAISSEEGRQLLEQYEMDMDRRLAEYERVTKDIEDEMRRDAESGQFDQMKRLQQVDKMAAPAQALRDINRDFVRRLGLSMGEEDREKLEREFLRRAHPRIYRESYPQQLFAAATGFSDLDDAQRESLRTLKEQYDRELRAANTEFAKATESAEDVAGGTIALQLAQWMPSDKEGLKDAQDAVKKARDARRALDKSYEQRIEQTLKLEQRNRLPARKASNDNPWEMFSQPEDDE